MGREARARPGLLLLSLSRRSRCLARLVAPRLSSQPLTLSPHVPLPAPPSLPRAPSLQGVRTRDNIRKFQKHPPGESLTEEELVFAVDALELSIAHTGQRLQDEGGSGIERLPGVGTLLNKLREGNARFGIVTSGEFGLRAPVDCGPGGEGEDRAD